MSQPWEYQDPSLTASAGQIQMFDPTQFQQPQANSGPYNQFPASQQGSTGPDSSQAIVTSAGQDTSAQWPNHLGADGGALNPKWGQQWETQTQQPQSVPWQPQYDNQVPLDPNISQPQQNGQTLTVADGPSLDSSASSGYSWNPGQPGDGELPGTQAAWQPSGHPHHGHQGQTSAGNYSQNAELAPYPGQPQWSGGDQPNSTTAAGYQQVPQLGQEPNQGVDTGFGSQLNEAPSSMSTGVDGFSTHPAQDGTQVDHGTHFRAGTSNGMA